MVTLAELGLPIRLGHKHPKFFRLQISAGSFRSTFVRDAQNGCALPGGQRLPTATNPKKLWSAAMAVPSANGPTVVFSRSPRNGALLVAQISQVSRATSRWLRFATKRRNSTCSIRKDGMTYALAGRPSSHGGQACSRGSMALLVFTLVPLTGFTTWAPKPENRSLAQMQIVL